MTREEMMSEPDGLRGSETVLLVDDNPEARMAMRRTLEWHGYTVLEAESAAQAIEVAPKTDLPIQLLVTDVMMPGMTGVSLARTLIKDQPTLRVLFVSGYTDREVPRETVAETETAFLQKPMTIRELAKAVRELLDRDSV